LKGRRRRGEREREREREKERKRDHKARYYTKNENYHISNIREINHDIAIGFFWYVSSLTHAHVREMNLHFLVTYVPTFSVYIITARCV